jgi:hypothetical protein
MNELNQEKFNAKIAIQYIVYMSIVLLLMFAMSGCACKPEMVPVVNTVEVKVPVKCVVPSCKREPLIDYMDKKMSIVDRAKAKATNDINTDAYVKCLEASTEVCK